MSYGVVLVRVGRDSHAAHPRVHREACGWQAGGRLRQVCLLGEHRRKAEVVQLALKRPAVGHLLAAGDAGLSDPREHEALEEAVLGHARQVPCT